MNKKLVTALVIAFLAVQNPVISLVEVQKALANESQKKAIAVSEANIAKNIQSLYESDKYKTIDEIAAIQIEAYKKDLETKKIKEKQEFEAKLAKENINRINSLRAAGLRTTFVNNYVKAQMIYGVPWEIVAAVHFVETRQSGNTTITSYAGAQGPMQFIPSTWRAYGQDGNGDGVASIGDVDDAIFGGANYLAANGAAKGNVINALLRYNHDMTYVYHVLSIARSIGFNK